MHPPCSEVSSEVLCTKYFTPKNKYGYEINKHDHTTSIQRNLLNIFSTVPAFTPKLLFMDKLTSSWRFITSFIFRFFTLLLLYIYSNLKSDKATQSPTQRKLNWGSATLFLTNVLKLLLVVQHLLFVWYGNLSFSTSFSPTFECHVLCRSIHLWMISQEPQTSS